MRVPIAPLLVCLATSCLRVNGPAGMDCDTGEMLVVRDGLWTCGRAIAQVALPSPCGPREAVAYETDRWVCRTLDAEKLEGRGADAFQSARGRVADSDALGGVASHELFDDEGRARVDRLPVEEAGLVVLDAEGKIPPQFLPDVQLPAGVVTSWAGPGIPEGWLPCDGRAYDQEDPRYQRLFAALGTAYGRPNGDPVRFHVPDSRGRFLRGVDGGTGRDLDVANRWAERPGANPGDRVGSVQGEMVGIHYHRIPLSVPGPAGVPGAMDRSRDDGGGASLGPGDPANPYVGTLRNWPTPDTPDGPLSGDTRPENVAITWIIKL